MQYGVDLGYEPEYAARTAMDARPRVAEAVVIAVPDAATRSNPGTHDDDDDIL